jgi:hypothetical protein
MNWFAEYLKTGGMIASKNVLSYYWFCVSWTVGYILIDTSTKIRRINLNETICDHSCGLDQSTKPLSW